MERFTRDTINKLSYTIDQFTLITAFCMNVTLCQLCEHDKMIQLYTNTCTHQKKNSNPKG